MNRLITVFLIFVLHFLQLFSQVNQYGSPFVRNYSPSEMDAAERNWAIVQDRRGIIYVGNDDRGVLEFDGKTWRKIPIPNNSSVRSLAINDENTVFVGAINEFGYLAPNESGLMQYHSLVSLVDEESREFGDIWKTYVINGEVYFCSQQRIFKYDQEVVTLIQYKDLNALFAFAIKEDLYLGSFTKGLMKLDVDTFQIAKNGEFFYNETIYVILPYSDQELIICTDKDIFLYNMVSGDISTSLFSSEITQYANNSVIYHGITLPNERFAFATLFGGGILIMDKNGKLIEQYNKSYGGLQTEMVAYLYHNSEKGLESPLWVALTSGVATIEFNSPVRFFNEESGLKGEINDFIRFRDQLYVATSVDVFYYKTEKNSPPRFVPLDIKNECWALFEFTPPGENASKLLVGTSNGVVEVKENKTFVTITTGLKNTLFYTFRLYQSKFNPGNVYLGLKSGIEVIQYKDKKWVPGDTIPFINEEIRRIAEDSEGNLWLATRLNGVIRVSRNEDGYIVDRYNEEHGFQVLKDIQIFEFENRLIFGTRTGFYQFNEKENKFTPDDTFGERFSDGSVGIYRFYEDGNNIFIAGNEGELIGLLSRNAQGDFEFVETPYRRIPKGSTPAIFPDKNEIVWLGSSFDLFSFNKKLVRNYTSPYNSIIRNITIAQDSVLFNGTFFRNVEGKNIFAIEQPDEMKPVIKYAFNSITFEFTAPFFENEDNIQYSYMLEGFNNVWSRWSTENKAVYTNLVEGDYTFMVKAINVYGVESVVGTYSFTILPPWSRSILAFIMYFIMAALIVWGIVVVNSRRLKREKIILEGIVRERTAEIVKQKDEIEQQRDMIAEQNKNITDSIEYARRIQSAILPPGDYIKELFPQRFILYLPRDIVSGDFYWLTKKNKQIISVAADCTGHGVPGGFMSMLGIAFLNEIVNKSKELHSNEILNQLRQQVIHSLHQTGKSGEAQDGMDVSLYILDHEEKKLQFSGANNPLIIIRNDEIIEIKGDKMPIGIHTRADEPFTNHEIDLFEGDVVYSFTDGYQDQFGGKRGKKFMSKNFKELLMKIHKKPMDKQKEILEKTLNEWQGSFERVDDILVMGVKI